MTETQELEASRNLLGDFPSFDAQTDNEPVTIPCNWSLRYEYLKDKILARRNVELIDDVVLLTEVNELLRRLIGLCAPKSIARLCKLSYSYLYETCADKQALIKFKDEVKQGLCDILADKYKQKQRKQRENQYLAIRAKINSGDIAAIKKQLGGFSNFHRQAKIANHTKQDSILYDLRNFMDKVNFGGDDTMERLFLAPKVRDNISVPEETNRKTINPVIGFKLNLKSNKE